MPSQGKTFKASQAKVDMERRYTVDEAVALVKDASFAKFDESVDASIRLGVNPRHADQMVRGAVSLPHGTGKTVRVLVFAQGEGARQAEEAGADVVGSDDLINKVQEGFSDFDKVVATRDMMGKVGRLGRVLGPRGLMPNPKVGTVVGAEAVGETVRQLKAGKIDFRVEKAGIIHAPIGRVSMSAEQLAENFTALLGALLRMKPSSAKGTYVRGVAISSTMGPGVKVDPTDAQRRAESV